MKNRIIVGAVATTAVLAGFVVGCGTDSLADGPSKNTDNDRELISPAGFTEYFKRDSPNGRKNYLYTVTEFVSPSGRVCTVVTGASETTISIDCQEAPR